MNNHGDMRRWGHRCRRGARAVPAAVVLLSALWLGPGAGPAVRAAENASQIKADEEVVFFPGIATDTAPPLWTAHVSGWIFEPKGKPGQSATLGRLLQEKARLTQEELASVFFRERARMFLVDNERRKSLSVTVSGRTVTLAPSKENGHFEDQITLNEPQGKSGEWIEMRAGTRHGDSRVFAGRIQLIGRRGVSVVSDIDDTIKDSNVLNKRELAANTFAREFRPVTGMGDLYRKWAAGGNVVFHYVSGSPWQLYPALAQFIAREGFPMGSFHLRPFRLKDKSAVEFLENRTLEYKVGVIETLMRRFPDRQFVLVGDSGERDSEVYAQMAALFPNQVRAIFIRNVVGGQGLSAPTFVNLPAHLRQAFTDPAELADFNPQKFLSR